MRGGLDGSEQRHAADVVRYPWRLLALSIGTNPREAFVLQRLALFAVVYGAVRSQETA